MKPSHFVCRSLALFLSLSLALPGSSGVYAELSRSALRPGAGLEEQDGPVRTSLENALGHRPATTGLEELYPVARIVVPDVLAQVMVFDPVSQVIVLEHAGFLQAIDLREEAKPISIPSNLQGILTDYSKWRVRNISFSADCKWFCQQEYISDLTAPKYYGDTEKIIVYDWQTGQQVGKGIFLSEEKNRWEGYFGQDVALSPDGKLVYVLFFDTSLRKWMVRPFDVETGLPSLSRPDLFLFDEFRPGEVEKPKILIDPKRPILYAYGDSVVHRFDLTNGVEAGSAIDLGPTVRKMALSPDGKILHVVFYPKSHFVDKAEKNCPICTFDTTSGQKLSETMIEGWLVQLYMDFNGVLTAISTQDRFLPGIAGALGVGGKLITVARSVRPAQEVAQVVPKIILPPEVPRLSPPAAGLEEPGVDLLTVGDAASDVISWFSSTGTKVKGIYVRTPGGQIVRMHTVTQSDRPTLYGMMKAIAATDPPGRRYSMVRREKYWSGMHGKEIVVIYGEHPVDELEVYDMDLAVSAIRTHLQDEVDAAVFVRQLARIGNLTANDLPFVIRSELVEVAKGSPDPTQVRIEKYGKTWIVRSHNQKAGLEETVEPELLKKFSQMIYQNYTQYPPQGGIQPVRSWKKLYSLALQSLSPADRSVIQERLPLERVGEWLGVDLSQKITYGIGGTWEIFDRLLAEVRSRSPWSVMNQLIKLKRGPERVALTEEVAAEIARQSFGDDARYAFIGTRFVQRTAQLLGFQVADLEEVAVQADVQAKLHGQGSSKQAPLAADISFHTAQGARPSQEDRYVNTRVELKGIRHGQGHLMVVIDGHSGDQAVELVVRKLQPVFETSLRATAGDVEEAWIRAIRSLHEQTKELSSGVVLGGAYVPDDEAVAHTASLGDALVIIRNSEGKEVKGPEHNVVLNPQEFQATMARGAIPGEGQYKGLAKVLLPNRHYFHIQFSRSLGDKHLDAVLNREPAVDSIPLGPASFILVATDGVFDALDPSYVNNPVKQTKRIEDVLRLVRNGKNAAEVVRDAIGRNTGDNATAIVWRSLPSEQSDALSGTARQELTVLMDRINALYEVVAHLHRFFDRKESLRKTLATIKTGSEGAAWRQQAENLVKEMEPEHRKIVEELNRQFEPLRQRIAQLESRDKGYHTYLLARQEQLTQKIARYLAGVPYHFHVSIEEDLQTLAGLITDVLWKIEVKERIQHLQTHPYTAAELRIVDHNQALIGAMATKVMQARTETDRKETEKGIENFQYSLEVTLYGIMEFDGQLSALQLRPVAGGARGNPVELKVEDLKGYVDVSPLREKENDQYLYPDLLALAIVRHNATPAAGLEEEFLEKALVQILEALQSTGPVVSLGQLFPKLIEEANEKNIPEAVPKALLAVFRSLKGDSEKQRHLTSSVGQAMMMGLHEFNEDFEPDPYPSVLSGRKTIWTVTTSPTIDIDAKRKLANWSDRKGVLVDPGGGGINVAIALARRGVRARPVFFYSGEIGKLLIQLIENRGVVVYKGDAIELKGHKQTRVTIVTSLALDKAGNLVPTGTPVDEDSRLQMTARLLDPQEGVKAGDIVVISGSLAPGLPDDFYADLGRQLVARGAIVVLDTKGAPARAVLFSRLAAATIYSQNSLEFGDLVGVDPKDRKALIAKAKEIIEAQPPDQAMQEIVITEGAGGAFSVTREKVLEIPAPKVESVSEVGAGDTSLAERTFRAWQGKGHDAGFVYGVAAGTASVLHPGTGGGLQAEVDHYAEELGLIEETKVKKLQSESGLEELPTLKASGTEAGIQSWRGDVLESLVKIISPEKAAGYVRNFYEHAQQAPTNIAVLFDRTAIGLPTDMREEDVDLQLLGLSSEVKKALRLPENVELQLGLNTDQNRATYKEFRQIQVKATQPIPSSALPVVIVDAVRSGKSVFEVPVYRYSSLEAFTVDQVLRDLSALFSA